VQAEALQKREQPAVKAPPADIRAYLKATGLHETRYVRMLSSLCAETYYLSKLSVRVLSAHTHHSSLLSDPPLFVSTWPSITMHACSHDVE
jgi:hypothetical protein